MKGFRDFVFLDYINTVFSSLHSKVLKCVRVGVATLASPPAPAKHTHRVCGVGDSARGGLGAVAA